MSSSDSEADDSFEGISTPESGIDAALDFSTHDEVPEQLVWSVIHAAELDEEYLWKVNRL
jgi:hypothetical protein